MGCAVGIGRCNILVFTFLKQIFRIKESGKTSMFLGFFFCVFLFVFTLMHKS